MSSLQVFRELVLVLLYSTLRYSSAYFSECGLVVGHQWLCHACRSGSKRSGKVAKSSVTKAVPLARSLSELDPLDPIFLQVNPLGRMFFEIRPLEEMFVELNPPVHILAYPGLIIVPTW